ncbi:FAD-dependent oxidoreductase, partial [Nocardia sp. NPDC058497]|uniref:FAD-dependent oxidoreductase n=1 Tax=Nocardia sp. NPDC058497 TaxID=3346529 RepID=UPI00364E0EC2
AYCLKSNAATLDALDPRDRHTAVLETIAALHPDIPAAAEPSDVQSISWSQVAHLQGAWVNWPSYEHHAYTRLAAGMGSVQLAGDWLNPLTAWMSGAFASATSAMLNLMKTVER